MEFRTMKARRFAALALFPLLMASLAAAAQTAEGRWKTIDDETGKVKSIVEITRAADGTLRGQVVEILHSDKGPNPVCDDCEGDNKGKPIKGMTIIWGMQDRGEGEYGGGRILDPSNGKTYKSKLELLGEDRLQVAGCILFVCRHQEWVRE